MSEHSEGTTGTIRCPDCGYTSQDAKIQGDHRLCKNYGFFAWEKGSTPGVQVEQSELTQLRSRIQELEANPNPTSHNWRNLLVKISQTLDENELYDLPQSVIELKSRAERAEADAGARLEALRQWKQWQETETGAEGVHIGPPLEATLAALSSDAGKSLLAERDRYKAALENLVNKLRTVHADPRYQGAWTVAQLHVGPYAGPTYTEELEAAEMELDEQCGAGPCCSPEDEDPPAQAARNGT